MTKQAKTSRISEYSSPGTPNLKPYIQRSMLSSAKQSTVNPKYIFSFVATYSYTSETLIKIIVCIFISNPSNVIYCFASSSDGFNFSTMSWDRGIILLILYPIMPLTKCGTCRIMYHISPGERRKKINKIQTRTISEMLIQYITLWNSYRIVWNLMTISRCTSVSLTC